METRQEQQGCKRCGGAGKVRDHRFLASYKNCDFCKGAGYFILNVPIVKKQPETPSLKPGFKWCQHCCGSGQIPIQPTPPPSDYSLI